MSEHTPGPWKAETNDRAYAIVRADWLERQTICTLWAIQGMDANARLIAAAPALLSLVQELLEVWDPEWEPGKTLHAKAVNLVALASPSVGEMK